MSIADFTISTDPSSNVGYDATNAQVLTLQLENLPATDVSRVQWSVTQYSEGTPALVFSPVSGEPTTPGGTVTLTCPATGTHSFIIDCVVNNGVDTAGVTRTDYRTARLVVIRSVGGLGKIVPGERTEYDVTYGWTSRINEAIDAADLLASATPDPDPNTLPLRDASGGCGFIYVNTGSTPASTGQLRMTNAGGIVADNGSGTDVTLVTQTAGAIEIGDAVDAESVTLYAAPDKNISAVVTGTGTAGLTAAGAASTVALASNSVNVFSGIGGNATLDSTTAISLKIGGTALADFGATGLTFANSLSPAVGVGSVAAGDGKNLLLSAGNVTAGAGTGGTVALVAGTNTGGATGDVGAILAIGSGGSTGNFILSDGSAMFLEAKATAALTTLTIDRALLMTIGNAGTLQAAASLTISADTGAAGEAMKFNVSNAERIRLKTTGFEFPTNSANALITQAASSSPQELTLRGAAGTGAGVDGSHVSLEVGTAGSGADISGELRFKLKLSNNLSGIWRMTAAGAAGGDDLAVWQYSDTTNKNTWTFSYTTNFTSLGAFALEVTDDAFATIATSNTQNVALCGTGDAGNGAGVVFIGNRSFAPSVAPTGGGILYVEAGALKFMGSGGTITPIAPA